MVFRLDSELEFLPFGRKEHWERGVIRQQSKVCDWTGEGVLPS